MTRRELIDFCLTYPDAYEDYPFDGGLTDDAAWAALRHKGNSKTFAFIYVRGGLYISLKCEPLRADFLRQVYTDVSPAYHMNKEHWNMVRMGGDVDMDALRDMIDHSWALTAPKRAK